MSCHLLEFLKVGVAHCGVLDPRYGGVEVQCAEAGRVRPVSALRVNSLLKRRPGEYRVVV